MRYPDAIVACAPQPPGATIVQNPVIVFEVVSEDSARTDRIDKLREHQATTTIACYIILEQKSAGATVFSRRGEIWSAAALTRNEILQLPQIGVSMPLAAFYSGVVLTGVEESAADFR